MSVDASALEVSSSAGARAHGDAALDLLSIVDARTRSVLQERRETTFLRRGWLMRRALLAADVLGLSVAFLGALALSTAGGPDHFTTAAELLIFAAALPVWVVLAKLHGLYDRDDERTDHSTVHELAGVFHVVTVGVWLVIAAVWLTGAAAPTVGRMITFWATAILMVTLMRAIARAICRHSIGYLQNTVIVGAGKVGQLVAKKLLQHPEYGINVVGFVDDVPRERREDLEHLALLGGQDRLPELIEMLGVERVIVAFSNDSHEETLDLIRSVQEQNVQIDIVPRLYEILGTRIGIHTVEGVPLLGMPPAKLPRSSRLLKRALDLTVATCALILLGPLFAVVAALIKLESRGPVFFRQIRMGTGERPFRIYKFRTMAADADARKSEVVHLNMHAQASGDPRMFKVPHDPRVTRVGRLLRRTSIDELPQLINVVKGEMSLVGPRPLILEEDRFVTEWARRRLHLKPGITGLWQVLGRSDIPFDEMKKLDYLYVTNWSLREDLRLILLTLPALTRARAAY
jgi:exopolysaccharide biosynthesis polyprenyl glycosylphosphotransferase